MILMTNEEKLKAFESLQEDLLEFVERVVQIHGSLDRDSIQQFANTVDAFAAEANKLAKERFSQPEKRDKGSERLFRENAEAMLFYLANSPDNPFPVFYRKDLAIRVNKIGEMMDDFGIELPDKFFPAIERVVSTPDGPQVG